MAGSTSLVWQTGVVPEQPLFPIAVQGTHVFVAVLQAGVAPEHCASLRQPQPPPDKQTRPPVHPQLVSGGVNASAPLSGVKPGASVFASVAENASIGTPVSPAGMQVVPSSLNMYPATHSCRTVPQPAIAASNIDTTHALLLAFTLTSPCPLALKFDRL